MPGRRTEHQRKESIDQRRYRQQLPDLRVCKQNASIGCQIPTAPKPHCQHAAGQSAGEAEKQTGEAEPMRLAAKGRQRHQDPHRSFHRNI